ncbi:protein of unknown function [Propionibacterium cyclohexanicum]|uniref:DUF1707 domain-containing protein n=1 Tax=Propionibacterium cyclohexanicum TaxID=64702 RepID=A0A1H9S4E0_9ACTN|nr:DUF1707 domain-containing protein [Propionibacterium cyclohexanicum]SER79892.1 protein of unknown function [Propionibacterium cyclohexanicum]
MSGLPIESNYSHEPTRPVTENERNELTRRVNEAYEKGELPLDSYQEIMDGLYSATTLGELVPLAQALPPRYRSTDPAGSGGHTDLAPGTVNTPVTRPDTSSRLVRAVFVSAAVVVLIVVAAIILGIVF